MESSPICLQTMVGALYQRQPKTLCEPRIWIFRVSRKGRHVTRNYTFGVDKSVSTLTLENWRAERLKKLKERKTEDEGPDTEGALQEMEAELGGPHMLETMRGLLGEI